MNKKTLKKAVEEILIPESTMVRHGRTSIEGLFPRIGKPTSFWDSASGVWMLDNGGRTLTIQTVGGSVVIGNGRNVWFSRSWTGGPFNWKALEPFKLRSILRKLLESVYGKRGKKYWQIPISRRLPPAPLLLGVPRPLSKSQKGGLKDEN